MPDNEKPSRPKVDSELPIDKKQMLARKSTRPNKLTPEQVWQMRRLYRDGKSLRIISDTFEPKVAIATIRRALVGDKPYDGTSYNPR